MKKEALLLILMILIGSFLAGCSANISGASVASIPHETTNLMEIYFCPLDNCEEKMLDVMKGSAQINCAFYDLNLFNLSALLKEKDARVVLDKNNANKTSLMNIKTNYGYQSMHNKFCVIDNSIVITGSMNPTYNCNFKNNNNLIIIRSSLLAKNYNTEFAELWSSEFGKGSKTPYPIIFINSSKIESYFCPEDSCKAKIISALAGSSHSIYFMIFSFTDLDIAGLLAKKSLIIDVRGIMEKRNINQQYSVFSYLKESSVNAIPDHNPQTMHHKVFIIDNTTVITGSMNPTKSANEKNDENLLIIHDEKIAKKYLEEFERLWENGNQKS